MKNATLEFLTPADWDLLLEHAQPRRYARGDTLLEGGAYSRAIFLIDEGIVRVEQVQAGQGRGIALAQLGPGETFGEMAFLDDTGASASIIAESAAVQVHRLDEVRLQALLAADPGLAVRFYQSLATSLARRLRKTSRRLSQLNVGEVAQVNHHHAPRTGNISARQIPAELAAGVEAFQQSLLSIDADLKAHRLPEAAAQARVSAACDTIPALLARHTEGDSLLEMGWDDLLAFRDTPQLESGVGDYVFRETFPSLMLSATIARCYTRPRGFADDFETIEMMYADQAEGDDRLGPYIDRWYLDRPLCVSRRSSRRVMADLIRRALREGGAEVLCTTSLGGGTARELFDVIGEDTSQMLEPTSLDLDDQALRETNRRADACGCNARMAFVQGNVVLIAQGQADLSLSPQRLLYALGLCDYLTNDEVRAVLDWGYDHLRPGGELVLTNLDPSQGDRLFMQHILEWQLHHRTEAELRALFRASRFGQAVTARLEPSGANWFVTGRRPG